MDNKYLNDIIRTKNGKAYISRFWKFAFLVFIVGAAIAIVMRYLYGVEIPDTFPYNAWAVGSGLVFVSLGLVFYRLLVIENPKALE
jgi:membrane-anchored protein YejM (alkaline phosphatase superfamily)